MNDVEKLLKRNWKDFHFRRISKDFGQRLIGKYEGGMLRKGRAILIYYFSKRGPSVKDFVVFLEDFERFYDQNKGDYSVEGAYILTYQDYDKETFKLLLNKMNERLRSLVRVSIMEGEQEEEKREAYSKDIFIVHGKDDKPKLELALMLKKWGLNGIILSEQPNKGRTIIEKLEQETIHIGYAFVILTTDDVGMERELFEKKTVESEKYREIGLCYRARQNVILELGYLVGKIGRNRVCCLYKGNVELPSDIHGVLFKKFNESVDECYKGIVDELRAANYEIQV